MTAMLHSRSPFKPSVLLGEPLGELSLRVGTPYGEERIVRLTGAKCSIGSGEQCSLRLRAPGIAASHCVILRGPEGIAIRSLGAFLRVNGEACDEARLHPGDTFDLGPIHFELLSDSGTSPRRSTQRRRLLGDNREQAEMQAAQVRRETRRQQHARLRKLLQAMRGDRQKAVDQRRDSDRRRRETEQLHVQLAQLQREVSEERNNAQRIEDQRRSSALHANQLQLSLERLRHELAALQTQQQQEADLFRQERARLSDDLTNRERHAHQLRVDLQQRLWDLEQLRLQLDRQQRQADLEREQKDAAHTQRLQEQELWLSERTRLAEEISLREGRAQQLQADLQTAQAACHQLQSELQRSKTTWEASERSLTRELERLQIVSQQAQADADNWKQAHANLAKDGLERERRTRELEGELAQHSSAHAQLTAALAQKCEQLEQLKGEAEEIRGRWDRDRAHLQAALDHQQTEESWHAEKVKLLESVTSRDREMDAQRTELQRITGELTQVRKQLEDQAQAIADREAAWSVQRTQSQSQLEEQQALTVAAENRREAIEQEMHQLREELARITAATDTWKQAAEDSQARVEQLETKLAAQNALLATHAQQTIALDTTQSQRYQSLERRVVDLTAEKDGLAQRVEELTALVAQGTAEQGAACEQLAREREQLAAREAELQELRLRAESQQAEWEARQAASDEQQAALAERERALHLEAQNLELRREELAAERTRLSERELELASMSHALPANDATPLSADQEQLERDRAMLTEEREQLAHERLDLERVRLQLADERAALAAQEQLLEQQSQQAAAEREALEATRQELAAESQRISSHQPTMPGIEISPEPLSEGDDVPPPSAVVPEVLEDVAETPVEPHQPELPPSDLEDEVLNGQTICPSSMDLSRLATLDFDSQPATPSAVAAPAESVEEVLARLGRQGLWKQEAETPDHSPLPYSEAPSAEDEAKSENGMPAWSALNSIANPSAPPEPAAWRAPASNAVPAEDDEESIDAYMARLMNRVQGSDGVAPPVVVRPVREVAEDNDTRQKQTPAPVPAPPTGEYSPRTAAPEQSHSLAAMREIANESARSAIRTHEKKSGKVRDFGHIASATVLAILSLPMLWLTFRFQSWLFGGSFVVTLCLVAWWLRGTFLALCRGLKRLVRSAVLPRPEAPQNNS